MNRIELQRLFNLTFDQIIELNKTKNEEYSELCDVFSNFSRASKGLSFHDRKEKVAWEYLTKHLQSIKDIINSNAKCSTKVIDEKFNDAITYLLLIKAMCYDENQVGSDNDVDKIKYNYTSK